MSKNSPKKIKIVDKTSKMLKNRFKTIKYVEKPLKNRKKCAKKS